jgi:hypothetical protein
MTSLEILRVKSLWGEHSEMKVRTGASNQLSIDLTALQRWLYPG